MTVSRRQFLTEGASAIAGASLAGPLARNAVSRVFTVRGPAKRVIILGAGISGLVAGYELTQLGHEVIILEARSRPGGRVHTIRKPFPDDLYAEEGAARIPAHHDLTLKYINQLQLPLEPMYPARLSALRFDGGRREVSIEDFTEGLGQYFGEELRGKPEHWFKIKGGTDLFPNTLAAKLADKIHYNSSVLRIEQDTQTTRSVFVQNGARQVISGDRILSTIPFSVLRKIELAGISDRKKRIIRNTHYDAASRVFVQVKKRLWEENGFSGFALTDKLLEVWHPTWNQSRTRGILMTYARPGEAQRIERMKEADRISSTVALLDSVFPGVRESFELGVTKCWSEDPWARGAWGVVNPRDVIAAQAYEGRIHFAGEHLSHLFSWMQGAIVSALRAVNEINEAPASISIHVAA